MTLPELPKGYVWEDSVMEGNVGRSVYVLRLWRKWWIFYIDLVATKVKFVDEGYEDEVQEWAERQKGLLDVRA